MISSIKNKFLALLVIILLPAISFAQNASEPEMADVMRSNGKIYVVLGVFLLVGFGLVGYLVNLDKKISKLEKEKS